MWWKKNKWKVIVPVLILAVLAGAFWVGGDSPGARGWKISKTDSSAQTQTEQSSAPAAQSGQQESASAPQQSAPETEKENDPQQSTPAETGESASAPEENAAAEAGRVSAQEPEKQPEPVKEAESQSTPAESSPAQPETQSEAPPSQAEPEKQSESQPEPQPTETKPEPQPEPQPEQQSGEPEETTCFISISCATILNNMSWCPASKVELVPADGWILPRTEVTFNEGESVFDILRRTCKKNKIHMEFSNNPLYNSAYIEGINNIYQFDVGELSGWMYSVNDWFPNYGCSLYTVQNGDEIRWVYTCDLGNDVGGGYAVSG